jgi:hypothetical protein
VIILSTCKTKNPSWFIDEQLPEGFEPHDYIECPELKEAMRALLDSEAMRLIELMAFHHWDSRVRKYARRVHDEVEGFLNATFGASPPSMKTSGTIIGKRILENERREMRI